MDPSSHRTQSPRIFVSHSHFDDEFGLHVVSDLRRALGEESAVWYDASGGLHGGDAWWRKIVSEITSRTVFIVILSPDSMESSWVNDEIDLAWAQKNARGMLILPILYRPCTIRADLTTRQIISFVPPVPYESGLESLLEALGLPKPATPITLLVMSITGAFPATHVSVDRDEVTIGRDASNDIVIADDAVSRFHLRLLRQAHMSADPDAWQVMNILGADKPYVNGYSVSWSPIHAGDQLVIGGTVMRIEPTDERALRTSPRLVVECESAQFAAPLRSAQVTLGRDPRSGILIPSPVISAQHATATLGLDGRVLLEDTGSRNGLYQQGSRVQRVTLQSGDQVTAGTSELDASGVTLTYLTAGTG